MAEVFKALRKKMPKQRSEMTDEEQMNTPEEGAQEQGFLETAEDALTQGKDQMRDQLGDVRGGSLIMPGSVGGMGFSGALANEDQAAGTAEKAAEGGRKLFNELGQRLPPKKGAYTVGSGIKVRE